MLGQILSYNTTALSYTRNSAGLYLEHKIFLDFLTDHLPLVSVKEINPAYCKIKQFSLSNAWTQLFSEQQRIIIMQKFSLALAEKWLEKQKF